jgi:hypothetical protein
MSDTPKWHDEFNLPRRLEDVKFLVAHIKQLEALLREAVDLAFNNSEQTCQYCIADSEHDSDCLVTRAKELLTSQPHEV